MIAVIFEVTPAAKRRDEYLDIAASLRPQLEQIDGFISIERFQSLAQPGKLLSLSFFRDEAAVKAWRSVEAHRTAQAQGRAGGYREVEIAPHLGYGEKGIAGCIPENALLRARLRLVEVIEADS